MGFDVKCCGAVLLVLMCATPALAAPSPAERDTARGLMIEGDRLRYEGDLESALARYQAAHAIMHVATTGIALAETQAALGLLVEARSTALELVGQVSVEGEPSVFSAARMSAASLAAKLERRVCTLAAQVTPAEAPYTLQIDDVVLPSAERAVPFKLNPGLHKVRIRASGYGAQEREVMLVEGVREQLSFELQADSPDDVPPRVVARVAAPSRALQIAAPTSYDPGHASRVRGTVAISVGGAALVAGIVTGTWSWLATSHERDRCDPAGQCEPSQASSLARANTLANVANITVPVGLLGLAYGIYELVTASPAPVEGTHARLKLQLTGQGVLVRGEL